MKLYYVLPLRCFITVSLSELTVLLLLPISRRLLQVSDDERRRCRYDIDRCLSVLDGQFHCDLQTLPVLRSLCYIIANFLRRLQERNPQGRVDSTPAMGRREISQIVREREQLNDLQGRVDLSWVQESKLRPLCHRLHVDKLKNSENNIETDQQIVRLRLTHTDLDLIRIELGRHIYMVGSLEKTTIFPILRTLL